LRASGFFITLFTVLVYWTCDSKITIKRIFMHIRVGRYRKTDKKAVGKISVCLKFKNNKRSNFFDDNVFINFYTRI